MNNIDFSRLTTAEERSAADILNRRLSAVIPKYQFCIGLAEIGIITDEECVAGAKGEWPEGAAKENAKEGEDVRGFSDFLDYLSPAEARNARTLWAATGDVMRMDGTILALAWWFDISDSALDAIFGIGDPDAPA